MLAGLWLVLRGLAGYRASLLVADTSTSTIASLAAGEVRISGVVEPAELTLVSLLQSAPCVYYRASIGSGGELDPGRCLHRGTLGRFQGARRDGQPARLPARRQG